jgi:hypothetical protein
VIGIGRIWHVSLSALGPEWLGSRVAEAAFQIMVTLLGVISTRPLAGP